MSTADRLPRTWAQTRAAWGTGDWLAIASIPLIFLVGFLTTEAFGVTRAVVVADAVVRVALCVAILLV